MTIPKWRITCNLVTNCPNSNGFYAARTKIGQKEWLRRVKEMVDVFGNVYELTTASKEIKKTLNSIFSHFRHHSGKCPKELFQINIWARHCTFKVLRFFQTNFKPPKIPRETNLGTNLLAQFSYRNTALTTLTMSSKDAKLSKVSFYRRKLISFI